MSRMKEGARKPSLTPAPPNGYSRLRLGIPAGEGEKRPLPPLNAEQEARARELRARVHALLPDMVPFIKDLAAEGLIDGWRCINRVESLGTQK